MDRDAGARDHRGPDRRAVRRPAGGRRSRAGDPQSIPLAGGAVRADALRCQQRGPGDGPRARRRAGQASALERGRSRRRADSPVPAPLGRPPRGGQPRFREFHDLRGRGGRAHRPAGRRRRPRQDGARGRPPVRPGQRASAYVRLRPERSAATDRRQGDRPGARVPVRPADRSLHPAEPGVPRRGLRAAVHRRASFLAVPVRDRRDRVAGDGLRIRRGHRGPVDSRLGAHGSRGRRAGQRPLGSGALPRRAVPLRR